jgi:hypothetical protein
MLTAGDNPNISKPLMLAGEPMPSEIRRLDI